MKSSDLVEVLKDLPEVRLCLITLAWELTGDDGDLDMDKLTFRIKEVKEAVDEAEAYQRATKEAVRWLRSLVHY